MNFDSKILASFNKEYSEIRGDLSDLTKQMIDTMFYFIINNRKTNKRTRITSEEILSNSDLLSERIESNKNKKLMKQLTLLNRQILNRENYLPILIKLQCSVGMYPNEFFKSYAKQIFHDEIFLPIMMGKFKDPYLENETLESKNLNSHVEVEYIGNEGIDTDEYLDDERSYKTVRFGRQRVLTR